MAITIAIIDNIATNYHTLNNYLWIIEDSNYFVSIVTSRSVIPAYSQYMNYNYEGSEELVRKLAKQHEEQLQNSDYIILDSIKYELITCSNLHSDHFSLSYNHGKL